MLFYVTFEITAISDLHLASEFTDWQNRGKLKGHLSCVCVCVCVCACTRAHNTQLLAHLSPILCDFMDCIPPVSSVHGIF